MKKKRKNEGQKQFSKEIDPKFSRKKIQLHKNLKRKSFSVDPKF